MSNSGTVVGNLTKDPQLSYSPAGKAYVRFTIAVSHRKMNKATNQWENDLTDYVKCVAFNQLAENLASLNKGTRVIVMGDWKPKEWQDESTGQTRRDRELNVSDGGPSARWQKVSAMRAPQNNDGGQGGGQQQYQNPQSGYQTPEQSYQGGGIDNGFDEQPF